MVLAFVFKHGQAAYQPPDICIVSRVVSYRNLVPCGVTVTVTCGADRSSIVVALLCELKSSLTCIKLLAQCHDHILVRHMSKCMPVAQLHALTKSLLCEIELQVLLDDLSVTLSLSFQPTDAVCTVSQTAVTIAISVCLTLVVNCNPFEDSHVTVRHVRYHIVSDLFFALLDCLFTRTFVTVRK